MEDGRIGAGPRVSNEISEGQIPERRLWTAVLVRAVEDWQSESLRAKRAGQRFLFEDSISKKFARGDPQLCARNY